MHRHKRVHGVLVDCCHPLPTAHRTILSGLFIGPFKLGQLEGMRGSGDPNALPWLVTEKMQPKLRKCNRRSQSTKHFSTWQSAFHKGAGGGGGGSRACWACKWGLGGGNTAPKIWGGVVGEGAHLTSTILAWRRGTALSLVHVSLLWGTPRRLG